LTRAVRRLRAHADTWQPSTRGSEGGLLLTMQSPALTNLGMFARRFKNDGYIALIAVGFNIELAKLLWLE
jgi:hypothetical protein